MARNNGWQECNEICILFYFILFLSLLKSGIWAGSMASTSSTPMPWYHYNESGVPEGGQPDQKYAFLFLNESQWRNVNGFMNRFFQVCKADCKQVFAMMRLGHIRRQSRENWTVSSTLLPAAPAVCLRYIPPQVFNLRTYATILYHCPNVPYQRTVPYRTLVYHRTVPSYHRTVPHHPVLKWSMVCPCTSLCPLVRGYGTVAQYSGTVVQHGVWDMYGWRGWFGTKHASRGVFMTVLQFASWPWYS